ncbi:hypothetical protein HaLaN_32916, partial [Haematococcus lacustris]
MTSIARSFPRTVAEADDIPVAAVPAA